MILIHKKTCRLSPGGVTISAFDHIKKDTEISRKNMLPCGSLPSSFSLSSSSFTKNPFYLQIYTLPMGGAKFVHPALFSIFITSLDLHVLVYSKNALGLCGILIAVFFPPLSLFFSFWSFRLFVVVVLYLFAAPFQSTLYITAYLPRLTKDDKGGRGGTG